MAFNSPIFLFIFIPIFYCLYFLLPPKFKNWFILIGSFIFYSWGEPTFVYVVFLSSFLDWILSKFMYKTENIKTKNIYLSLLILLNIGFLFYFKYFNFFIDNVNDFLTFIHFKPLGVMRVALPLAISFITFEKITYVVDVYKNKGKPSKSLLNYLTYVFIFPKLIAGPIIKYHDIELQIENRDINANDLYEGFFRFSKGLFKKVFIADTMGNIVDHVFLLLPTQLGFLDSWLGVLCFTIQIYFDFSGYSDMAIGLLRAMGFRIMENFNLPYISKNFTEFWRRWHISLSTFIRDYLYIPLGGNRCSEFRQYFNLIFCFLVSGLWHGASWNFVLWGIYHGCFLTVDKALGIKPETKRYLPRSLQVIITFLLVIISWTIFRSQNIFQILTIFKAMLEPKNHIFSTSCYFTKDVTFFLILGLVVSFFPASKLYTKIRDRIDKYFYIKFAGFFLLLLFSIGKISVTNFVTFIYFRF